MGCFVDDDYALDNSQRRASQWQSSLGWDDVPNVNESRRHSLADIPTRRGSLAGGEPSMLSRTYTHDAFESESPTSIGPARRCPLSAVLYSPAVLPQPDTPALAGRACLYNSQQRHLISRRG